ncbi:MAG TPA: phosphoribosyltransferase family protein [Longimicrobiales bacterium]|nr:phosphoribosyltransferase family protein [Longimicrobiales bacterium]
MERYRNRTDAGATLAKELKEYAGKDVVVLGLARGGVPVAAEVARALGAPLDVMVVRKLGVPGHEELAMGAIASGGMRVLNSDVLDQLSISEDVLARTAAEEERELVRRERVYRQQHPALPLNGRTVILVDDGLATGASMRAAAAAVREHDPAAIVVAVPVAAPEACQRFGALADDVVCVLTPEPFSAVGAWYEDFAQTTDEDVRRILEQAWGVGGGPM